MKDTVDSLALWADLRAKSPLVLSVTNLVVTHWTANVLLALGASPIMAHAVEELDALVGISNAVSINIGTLDAAWVTSMRAAVGAAGRHGRPWVLDPVGAGASAYRTETSLELLAQRPALVRSNLGEALALLGETGVTRGVDSGIEAQERAVVEVARAVARRFSTVAVVTGARDVVSDGDRTFVTEGTGVPQVTRITGTGCALSATCAAFLGAGQPPIVAGAAACSVFKAVATNAASRGVGLGTLAVALLDALSEGPSLERGPARALPWASEVA
jgi:hydroxyethylthiazole kinase